MSRSYHASAMATMITTAKKHTNAAIMSAILSADGPIAQGEQTAKTLYNVSMNTTPLCQCGCGESAPICTHTDLKAGIRKGEPRRFRQGHQFKLCTNNPAIQKQDPVANFWAKVQKTDSCWLWTAALNKDGYGVYGRGEGAHRYSYRLAFGEIPSGKLVCHRCDNPRCVRPEHLFVGTQKDNIQDALSKNRMSRTPRGPTKENSEKTHCLHGHPLSGANLTFDHRGHRSCLACRRIRGRVYDAQRRTRHRANSA